MADSVAERIQKVQAGIAAVSQRSGRRDAVRLVAVSKTVAPERMMEAYRAGLRVFGENKVQEYLDKKDLLPADVEWHFIGHLQTNKVKPVLEARARGQLALVHSLDRTELLREIEKQAARLGGKKLEALLQVNTSGESSKGGFKTGEIEPLLKVWPAASPVKLRGLMTIGPMTEDAALRRAAFRGLRELQERLKQSFPAQDWSILSMGMSGDYAAAIEEGSNLVRIGSAIFGARG